MISSLTASIVLFFFNRFGIQLVLNVVVASCAIALNPEKEYPNTISFKTKLVPSICVVVIGLISVGLFVIGHPIFGVINALLALFALIAIKSN